jgi:hypothetical protein
VHYRAVECAECCTFIRQCDYKQHCARLCLKRQVPCPNCIFGCAEIVRFDEKDVHMHLQCKYRSVLCRIPGCNTPVRYKEREEHEVYHCKHRYITCDLCGQSDIRSFQISEHLHNRCPERMVKCSVGCGQFLKAKDLEDHEQFRCVMPCKWGCGERLGPVGNRRYHESIACKKRAVVCANACRGCTITGLTAQYADEHQNKQCLFRLQVCSSGCGTYVSRKEQAVHSDPWHGSCKFVYC